MMNTALKIYWQMCYCKA